MASPPRPHSAPPGRAAVRASPPRHPRSAPHPVAMTSRARGAESVGSSSPPHADTVMVFALRDSGAELVAQLGRRTGEAHPAKADVRDQAPAEHEAPGEVVLAFCSEGSFLRLAYLTPDAPWYIAHGDEGNAEGEGEDDVEREDDAEEEREVDDSTYTGESEDAYADDDDEDEEGEREKEDASTYTGESEDADADDEDEDEEKEEEREEGDAAMDESVSDGSSNDECNEDEDEEEEDSEYESDYDWAELPGPVYSLKLRVWPSCRYANIVLFDGIRWISTLNYTLSWLSREDAETMAEKLAGVSQIEMKLVSNAMLPRRGEYEGPMVNSESAEIFMKFKLRPRLHHFNVHDILGKGGFGNVRFCTARDQKDYAMKIIKCEENEDIDEPREVAVHSTLRCPHVVKFLQAWTESHISVSYEECLSSGMEFQSDSKRESGEAPKDMQCPRYILILMELCQGTLADYLSAPSREVDAEKSLHIFKEIARGVQYVHGVNVIHRDLKPSNIFMGKDNKFKLGDFGQSRVQPRYTISFKGTPSLGTRFYRAPELAEGEIISDKVDIYPLGVIYFELFNEVFTTAMAKNSLFTEFKEDDGSNISWEGDFCLFKQMIAFDPVKRPSVNDVLEHISQVRKQASCTVDGLDHPGESKKS